MSIHYADIKNSPRLQRLLRCLESQPKESGGWVTTMSIIEQARVCAVNSAISELRRNGFTIDARKSKTGNAWEYRMVTVREEPLSTPSSSYGEDGDLVG